MLTKTWNPHTLLWDCKIGKRLWEHWLLPIKLYAELPDGPAIPLLQLEICVKISKQKPHLKWSRGASLVAQWLRICLLMQGTRVRALVWEDPTCRGAAGPVSHNY